MAKTITLNSKPLTLAGLPLELGQKAPDFIVVGADMKEKRLSDFSGKLKIISSFPSLDTPVCDLQVKEFNKRAASLSDDALIIGISKDLPFAQKRFCDAHKIEREIVFSDYRYSSFGMNYGLLIKELNLLARSVMIVDQADIVQYFQLVDELTRQPDYDSVLAAFSLITSAGGPAKGINQPKCASCEGKINGLTRQEAERLLPSLKGWQLNEDGKLKKEFSFSDAREGKFFLDLVWAVSESAGHHPTATLSYNKVKITLITKSVGKLTANDFDLAIKIDKLMY